jgi:hypothetical protein
MKHNAFPSQSVPKKRKSTGKRLRFSVFQRDHFTCQYCGAQPPDVVLVCDHIMPAAKGGTNTIDNLISACEACNQGKADRSLEDRPARPDADLMYLETQQEIAELRRYQVASDEREQVFLEIVVILQERWLEYSGLDWSPNDHVIRGMLMRHDPDTVEQAVVDVAQKVGSEYLDGRYGKWLPYLNAVARNIAAANEEDD